MYRVLYCHIDNQRLPYMHVSFAIIIAITKHIFIDNNPKDWLNVPYMKIKTYDKFEKQKYIQMNIIRETI